MALHTVYDIDYKISWNNPSSLKRFELGHFLSTLAGVPLGDVLVNDVRAVNISGQDCLTASLWITGVDGMYGRHLQGGKAEQGGCTQYKIVFS